jgi:hypothetical protein
MNPLARDFHFETPLETLEGIVVPDGDAWKRCGEGLAGAVKEMVDRAPPVHRLLPGAPPPDLPKGHRILVGTVHTNPLIARLYRRKHTLVDDFFPGPGGWVVQTVHNPGNVGFNVIIVGLSDPGMLPEVLEAFRFLVSSSDGVFGFVNRVKTQLEIPRLSVVEQKRWKRKARASFKANTGRDALERGIESGLTYALTGYAEYLEVFVFAIRHYHSLVRQSGGEWEFEHMLFPYAWIWRLAWLWDMIEESSLLSDHDRLEIITVLKGLADYTSRLVYFRDPLLRQPAIRHNHPTFAALSMFFSGRYFRDQYGDDSYDAEMEAARLIIDGQRDSFKPDDDANGYCWLAPAHILHYDLAHDDFRWIEEGHLRRVCEYAELTTDNLNAPVGFGDVTRYYPPGWCHRQLRFLLTAASAFYRNGAYRRLLSTIPPSTFDITPRHAELGNYLVDSVGHYALDLDDGNPVLAPGCQVAPLTPDAYRLLGREVDSEYHPFRPEGEPSEPVPAGKAFDKCALRGGYGANDEYLILDGIAGFVHDHEDVGSILRLTWKARMWLTEGDYIRSLPKYHNSLVSVCDGEAGPIPKLASLEFLYERGETTFLQVRVGDYNGVHWRRNIIWKRGAWFLFVDAVDFLREADYVITLFWRLLGQVRASSQSTTSRQDGVLFRITHGDSSRKSLVREPVREIRIHNGAFHRDYPHATDPTKVLRQEYRVCKGDAVEGVVFFNLMTCGRADEAGTCRLTGMGDGVARLSTKCDVDSWTIYGRGFETPGVDIRAEMALVCGDCIRILQCQALQMGDCAAAFSEAVFLELDRKQGRALVLARPGTRVSGNMLVPGGLLSSRETWLDLSPKAGATLANRWPGGVIGPRPAPATADVSAPPEKVTRSGGHLLIDDVAILQEPAAAIAWSRSTERLFILEGTRRITAIDRSGQSSELARFRRPITAIHPYEHDGLESVVVGGTGYLGVADGSGAVRWQEAMPRSHYRIQNVNDIAVATLEEGAEPSILACTDGWLVHCFNLAGERRWVTQIHHHAAKSLVVGDVDGDGRREILVATEYHTSDLLESNGEIRWTIDGGPEFVALGFCDLDSDGILESIYGSESGTVYGVHSLTGKILWKSNLGDRAHVAAMVTIGNGNALFVGSVCGEVARLDATGRKVWRQNLGGEVIGLCVSHRRAGVVAFTREGSVVRLDPDGRVMGRCGLEVSLGQVASVPNMGKADTFYLATGDRRILRITT